MTKTKNDSQGGVNALKGFRSQFLYTLLRVLQHKPQELIFKPEGEYEDLDILGGQDEVLEVIQIKDYTDELHFYNILSKSKQSTLVRRGLDIYEKGYTPTIKLISFSKVDSGIQELAKSTYSDKLEQKLKKLGLSKKQIKILKESFTYEIIDRAKLEQDVSAAIRKWNSSADSKMTQDLLLYWTYLAAEKQATITPLSFKEQFDKICKFGRERIAFYQTYQTLIKPFDKNLEIEDQKLLQSNFYQGIAATYKHILADVDVVREEKLMLLKEKFRKANIVFIHGASGQGKSTLAYRYLHNYCCDQAVFELKHTPGNIVEIYQMIEALEGRSKGINFPITLYIDVEPDNREWISILTELATKKHFNFLVTIREEDWNATEVRDQFEFESVELALEEKEAELIYNSLNTHQTDLKFIDFNDAWATFGGKGPLLEFVYLVTQHQSLSAKLESQIDNITKEYNELSEEKIKLLSYISLADTYGAKVKYKEMAESLSLRNIKHLVKQLQREYLIKFTESKSHLVGSHPIRSSIIKSLLFDDEINVEAEYALQAIPFIDDNSLLIFLRNAFTQGKLKASKLLDWLKSYTPTSWQAYYLILKSLLWKGVYDYIEDNSEVLNQVYDDYKTGWEAIINCDILHLASKQSLVEALNHLESFSDKEQQQYAKSANQSLTNGTDVFKYVIQWLSGIMQIDLKPQNTAGWNGLGLYVFWLIYLSKTKIIVDFGAFDYSNSLMEQPLLVQAYVIYALKNYNNVSTSLTKQVEDLFLEDLFLKYQIIHLEHQNEAIDCAYIFDIVPDQIDEDEENIFHARTMEIIDLLRLVFPNKEKYNVKGVGNKFSFIPDKIDSTKKTISRKSLPFKPLTEVNSTFINLFNYQKRTENWQKYVHQVMERRKLLAGVLKRLVVAFRECHRNKDLFPLAKYADEYIEVDYAKIKIQQSCPVLPQNIIDFWGEFDEGNIKKIKSSRDKSNTNQQIIKGVLPILKYQSFLGLYKEFDFSLEHFLRQSRGVILKKVKELVKQDTSHLPDLAYTSLSGNLFQAYEFMERFHQAFRWYFEKFTDVNALRKLEKEERESITALCFLYKHFIDSRPGTFLQSNKIIKYALDKVSDTQQTLLNALKQGLKNLAKKDSRFRLSSKHHKINSRYVITIDIDDPLDSIEIVTLVYNKLYEIIGQPEFTSLKYLILAEGFSIFNIIPLIQGKSLHGTWYEFNLYALKERKFEQLEQFHWVPKNIPDEYAQQIELWEDDLKQFTKLNELPKSTQTLNMLVFHLDQLGRFDLPIDKNWGEQILANHVEKIGSSLQQNMQTALDLYTYYAQLIADSRVIFDDAEERQSFCDFLTESHRYFYLESDPNQSENVSIVLNPETISKWVPRLQVLIEKTMLIYNFLVGKIIDGKLEGSPIKSDLEQIK